MTLSMSKTLACRQAHESHKIELESPRGHQTNDPSPKVAPSDEYV